MTGTLTRTKGNRVDFLKAQEYYKTKRFDVERFFGEDVCPDRDEIEIFFRENRRQYFFGTVNTAGEPEFFFREAGSGEPDEDTLSKVEIAYYGHEAVHFIIYAYNEEGGLVTQKKFVLAYGERTFHEDMPLLLSLAESGRMVINSFSMDSRGMEIQARFRVTLEESLRERLVYRLESYFKGETGAPDPLELFYSSDVYRKTGIPEKVWGYEVSGSTGPLDGRFGGAPGHLEGLKVFSGVKDGRNYLMTDRNISDDDEFFSNGREYRLAEFIYNLDYVISGGRLVMVYNDTLARVEDKYIHYLRGEAEFTELLDEVQSVSVYTENNKMDYQILFEAFLEEPDKKKKVFLAANLFDFPGLKDMEMLLDHVLSENTSEYVLKRIAFCISQHFYEGYGEYMRESSSLSQRRIYNRDLLAKYVLFYDSMERLTLMTSERELMEDKRIIGAVFSLVMEYGDDFFREILKMDERDALKILSTISKSSYDEYISSLSAEAGFSRDDLELKMMDFREALKNAFMLNFPRAVSESIARILRDLFY